MKKSKKTGKIKFKKNKLKETNKELVNPERGWYQIHTFVLGEEVSMRDREYTLNSTDTLAFVLINISAYKNKDLDEIAEKSLHKIFDFFRDYGLDMIVRVVYDTVGNCLQSEPDDEEQIMTHMRQLGVILKEYVGEIYVYQGLLIGNWGEMHSSKFLSPARLCRLAEVFMEELKGTAFMAVRRPAYVRILFPQGEDVRQSQVGIFDDAILASPTHLGTFGEQPSSQARRDQSWRPVEELKYVSSLCDRVPYGGEALWSDEKDGLEKVRGDLKLLEAYMRDIHISYLNRVHDKRFLDKMATLTWKGKDIFRGMNGYDYIGRHLGYRFVIRNVSCKVLKQDKSLLNWEITIENVGFSRSFFETKTVLTGEDEMGSLVNIDISDWMQLYEVEPGKEHVFHIHTTFLYGKISLYVTKKTTGRAVFFANESIVECKAGELIIGENK